MAAAPTSGFTPLVTVVGFHHARGPEVETWFGAPPSQPDPAAHNDWPHLPFMALSDGAHTSTEDFSYFTLRQKPNPPTQPHASSLFGISCTRQLDASQLIDRPSDVTRSTVQKAVVVIADSPQAFGQVREKLGMVTKAWFHQKDFGDVEILKKFQESLVVMLREGGDDRDQYLGLSLRELIHEFKHETLVLFKCCLLQPKMLFFGSRCERLCMMQFSLISLIPGLIRNLRDCADPDLDNYAQTLVRPTSLKTSERTSLLSYMGLPLQIFGKGSLFGPYTPLQQLDVLADHGTTSYIVGSTNSLLLQQRDRYSDILINLDEGSIAINSPSLRSVLALSVPDRRWIDFLTQSVQDTWDEANPGRPKTLGYVGSEEFIRLQFEEYLLSMISSVKYHLHYTKNQHQPRALLADIEGDPSVDFSPDWVAAWMRTENFQIWQKHTDSHLFDILEPKHPCAGGLTIEDIQRRLAQQVQTLHLDAHLSHSRERLTTTLSSSQKKVSSAFNNLWADIEELRETQRRRQAELQLATPRDLDAPPPAPAVDLAAAQQTVKEAGTKVSGYLSSWASWAGEKRKASGWGNAGGTSPSVSPGATVPASPPPKTALASPPSSSSGKRKSIGGLKRMSGHYSSSPGGLMELQLGKRGSQEGRRSGDARRSTESKSSFEEEVFDQEATAPRNVGVREVTKSEVGITEGLAKAVKEPIVPREVPQIRPPSPETPRDENNLVERNPDEETDGNDPEAESIDQNNVDEKQTPVKPANDPVAVAEEVHPKDVEEKVPPKIVQDQVPANAIERDVPPRAFEEKVQPKVDEEGQIMGKQAKEPQPKQDPPVAKTKTNPISAAKPPSHDPPKPAPPPTKETKDLPPKANPLAAPIEFTAKTTSFPRSNQARQEPTKHAQAPRSTPSPQSSSDPKSPERRDTDEKKTPPRLSVAEKVAALQREKEAASRPKVEVKSGLAERIAALQKGRDSPSPPSSPPRPIRRLASAPKWKEGESEIGRGEGSPRMGKSPGS